MTRSWTRLLRSFYRKEPISGFMLTIGAVDAAIGGIDGHWGLLALGLGTASTAAILRWWLMLPRTIEPIDSPPIRYLPDRSSRPSLPNLDLNQKHR